MSDMDKPNGKKRMWARLGVISALGIAIAGATISHLDTVTGHGVRIQKVEEHPLEKLGQLVAMHSIGDRHRDGYGAVNDKLDDMDQRNEDRFDTLENDVQYIKERQRQQDERLNQIEETIEEKGTETNRKLDEILRELKGD